MSANTVVHRLLGSPLAPLLGRSLTVLRYRARSGATISLPVQYARAGDTLVVLAGDAGRKTWWRHFTAPAPVEVLLGGDWLAATGRLDPSAGDVYRRAFPRRAVPPAPRFVRIDLR
ncbi:hypothetical protein Asp14428_06000 [Actinoplanes sp. NBRC 14428]|uniref:Deazaflavin-dependent oxidoreductase (Nitroreductase family) n=1 Tax=Pseudosporangium ferrugineum TaxID=439699 RepID=A0A2T0SHL8_9ACTN|nr:hypothetical protein [Pseudosporangium ferrugineum]PRY32914.1 hypothetical protein CLV70_10173 [Pseudosporangium ferrugineum]BCJ49125.1 hypothetical protein Asp14428_06000 [Actinoplanes sp. NBRC 14428]